MKLAWSYSRLNKFKNCPWSAYWNNYAPKGERLKYVQGAGAARGDKVHKMCEAAVNGDMTPLILDHNNASPLLRKDVFPKVTNLIATARTSEMCAAELKVVFREDKTLCDWFDKDTWVRSSYDMVTINGARCDIFDWKTGKKWEDKEQAEFYAGTAFTRFPQVEEVHTHYLWLDQNDKTDAVYYKKSEPHIWHKYEERAEEIEIANIDGNWEKRPSFLCDYCNVPKSKCEYSKVDG
jgi:hypothetical protein